MDNEKRIKDLEKTIGKNEKEINRLNKQIESLKERDAQPACWYNDSIVEKAIIGSVVGMLLFNLFKDL